MTTTAPGRVDPSGSGAPIRPPERRRPGLSLLGVPVSTVVAIELIAICALLVAEKKLVVTVIAAVVGVLIAIAALLRRRTIRIGTWLLLRIGYALRHRETLVAAAQYAGGRRTSAATDDRGDHLGIAPEIEAFFPSMTVQEARTHDDQSMGVVHWYGTCAATVRIGRPSGIVRARNTSDTVPLAAIVGAFDAQQDLGLDSVQVLTQTIVGEPDPGLTPLLAVADAELGGGGAARVRNRVTFVTVRLDPSTAAEAIAARGGGHTGIARVLSVALNRIRMTAGEHGLDVVVLDPGDAARAIAESLYHLATPYDPIIRWTESVRHIASTRMAHRSFVVSDVRRQAIAEVPVGRVFAYALGTQAKPLPGGGWSTRTVLRLTCRSVDSLNDASGELQAAARRSGITLQPLDAVQHLGMRATVPIGGT